MTYRRWPYLSADARIERLEAELREAREAVVRLLPESIQEVVGGYHRCASRSDFAQWEHALIDAVIASAQPLSRDEGSYWGPRAYCPLCGSGSTAPYEHGFALPEGLNRHLAGKGNTYECHVLAPAIALARDYLEPRFREAEAEREAAAEADRNRRRAVEQLYQIAPTGHPLLLDEQLWFRTARDKDSLEWAIRRISDLGFAVEDVDRVRSFSRSGEGYVVYADPRGSGQIEFGVYPLSPTGKPRRSRGSELRRAFSLPDAWKHRLADKFNQRLHQALRDLKLTAAVPTTAR